MRGIDYILVLLANFSWGFNFIAGKLGADQFQPLFFTSLRFLVLLFIMLPWLKPAPGYMKPLLKVAFMLGVLHFSMIFIGLHAGGNIASVAIAAQLYVPFAAILAFFFLREKISAVRIIAIAIAFTGVLVTGFDPVVFTHLDALLWTMGAALAMAAATIVMRQFPNLGVFTLQAWIALVAMPSLLVLSILFEDNHLEILRAASLGDFWAPVYSAVGASVIGHGIVYRLLGKYPVSLVTPLLLLAPVIASALGVVCFGDDLSWKMLLGGSMTIAGILLVSLDPEILPARLRQGIKLFFSKK